MKNAHSLHVCGHALDAPLYLDRKVDVPHALVDEILLHRVAFRVLHDTHVAARWRETAIVSAMMRRYDPLFGAKGFASAEY
jgi:hypothetical protein